MADKKISALPAATTPLAGTEVLPVVQSGTTDKVSVANLTAGRSVAVKDLAANSGAANQESRFQYSDNTAGRTVILRMSSSSLAPYDGYGAYIKATQGGGVDVHSLAFGTTLGTPSDKLSIRYDGLVTVETDNLKIGTAGKGIDFSANANAPGMTSELLTWYEEGTWTPVISSAAGTITSYSVNSASYTRIGRRVIVDFDITITNNGTGTAGINITGVPFAVATAYASCGSFREVAVTGNVGAIIANSGTNLQAANYDNAYAGGTNYRLVGTFSYNA